MISKGDVTLSIKKKYSLLKSKRKKKKKEEENKERKGAVNLIESAFSALRSKSTLLTSISDTGQLVLWGSNKRLDLLYSLPMPAVRTFLKNCFSSFIFDQESIQENLQARFFSYSK